VPASNGTPTIATSQFETSLSPGSLANVDAPANRGTLVPLTGCIGVLSFFFSLTYYNKYHDCFIYSCGIVGCRNDGRLIYLCNLIPRNRSDLLLNISTVVNNAIDKATKHVAIHKITGLVS